MGRAGPVPGEARQGSGQRGILPRENRTPTATSPYDEAIVGFRKTLEVCPDWIWGHTKLGVAYAFNGMPTEAQASAALSAERRIDPLEFAGIHAALGEDAAALEWLERGYDEHGARREGADRPTTARLSYRIVIPGSARR